MGKLKWIYYKISKCWFLFLSFSYVGVEVLNHSTIHWWAWNVPSESSSAIRFSSLFAPGPGLKTSASPQTEHVSFPASPKHHPPGKIFPGLRPRISWSMRSRATSFNRNCVAKAAPLWIMSSKSLEPSLRGSSLAGLSKDAYCRLWFTIVLLNCRELQRMVGK